MSVTTDPAQKLSTRSSASKFLTFLIPKTLPWLDMGLAQRQRPTWLMRTVVFFGGATDTCRVKKFGLENRSRFCWTIERRKRSKWTKKWLGCSPRSASQRKSPASPPAACFGRCFSLSCHVFPGHAAIKGSAAIFAAQPGRSPEPKPA